MPSFLLIKEREREREREREEEKEKRIEEKKTESPLASDVQHLQPMGRAGGRRGRAHIQLFHEFVLHCPGLLPIRPKSA